MTSAKQHGLVVVDTNVLLAATDRGRHSHRSAIDFIEGDHRPLALTQQIVREYLAVATRPIAANGLGLSASEASSNIRQFVGDAELLPENRATTRRLMELIDQEEALGKQVHDANIVAVALTHRASVGVTDNVRHFSRFASMIEIEALD